MYRTNERTALRTMPRPLSSLLLANRALLSPSVTPHSRALINPPQAPQTPFTRSPAARLSPYYTR